MFWKKRKKEKVKYDVASENLAVPEVHTGEVEHTEIYENLRKVRYTSNYFRRLTRG